MNNFIEYFYDIKVDNIKNYDKFYFFIYQNYIYKLYLYDNNSNIDNLVDINRRMLGNTLISEIIINRNGQVVSAYNGIGYILIKIYANINKIISLEEISYLNNSLSTNKININWGMLWSRKIDYLEDLINENGKKYPLIVDSFNYFVGMAENAISYYNNISIDKNQIYYISHKKIRFNDTIEVLYNPLNIVFDYKVRDVAEYIKNSFFQNNRNILNELNNYMINNRLSLVDVKLLISRILYPSFYFDLYEDILIDNKDEKIIIDITKNLDSYENYLATIISYFRKFYDIDEVLWLKKIS